MRVRERAADGSESHKVHELRIGMKDVEPNDDGDEDEDVEVDPFFFDDGYDVAASTGFTRVWEGAEALTAHLERTGLGRGRARLGAGRGRGGMRTRVRGARCARSFDGRARGVRERDTKEYRTEWNGTGDGASRRVAERGEDWIGKRVARDAKLDG